MKLGNMNTFIDIISTEATKDAEGFVARGDNILASVRACKEVKNGTEKWANMAHFSEVNALFRFRKIPGVEIKPSYYIVCSNGRYKIVGAEDVRGMYWEIIAEKIEGSG
jgi:hypothetical protein